MKVRKKADSGAPHEKNNAKRCKKKDLTTPGEQGSQVTIATSGDISTAGDTRRSAQQDSRGRQRHPLVLQQQQKKNRQRYPRAANAGRDIRKWSSNSKLVQGH
ncbi:hypothetical protein TNCV_2835681 [Trichonephila clavipes]|nr:hypothetical protein TNCV_2835681 [Trichonephila clavipes]